MKIINTSFRQDNAFHKMKGSGASSFPSGFKDFQDLKNNSHNSNKAFNTFNNSPAFTGFRPDLITQAAVNGASNVWHKIFSKNVVQIKNYGEFLSKTDEFVGEGFISARVEKFKNLLGEKKAGKILRLHDDTLEFVESSMASKLLNGLLDIPRILLDAPNALIRGAKKLPVVGKMGLWDTIASIPPLKNRANQKAAMDIFYRLKGMAEYEKTPELIRREIFKVPAGAAVANYVTKDERSLNRLATGAVSTWFVGNDFYNLAMYEKNDSKEAKKTANKRMRREMVRIGSSAIMTYSVLSALSTYVNKSRVLACVAIAGSAFFTEVISRVLTGTPLLPLTPKGAKKLNKKRAEKKEKLAFKMSLKDKKDIGQNPQTAQNVPKNAPQGASQTVVQNIAPQNAAAPFVAQSVWYGNQNNQALKNTFSQFASPSSNTLFKGDALKTGMRKQDNNVNFAAGKDGNNNQQVDRNKPFGLKHLAGAALTALGISLLYCAARTRSAKLNNLIEGVSNYLHNFRKFVSTKDLVVNNEDLQKFFEGFDGLQSERIRRGYSLLSDVEFTKEQALRLMSRAKDGVVSIDKDNPIFARAYLRTAAELDPVSVKVAGSECISGKSLGTVTDKPVRPEYSAAAVRSKLIGFDEDFLPKHTEEPEGFAAFISELKKKPDAVTDDAVKKLQSPYVIPDVPPRATRVKEAAPVDRSSFKSELKFKNIECTFDLEKPIAVKNGVEYFKMKDAVFNFGKIEETKLKIVIDALEIPIKYAKMVFTFPLKIFRKATGIEMPKIDKKKDKPITGRVTPDLGELYRDCSAMFKKYKKGKITKEEFSKYIESVNMKPFSIETTTRYSPTSLASLSRNFVTIISSYFFINDFRNEILLQSDGENTAKASEVTKERTAHKLSNFVLNKFFMEVFNNAFNKQYLSSLFGATAVAMATELTNESSVRVSIGVPTRKMDSREAIDEYEQKHLEAKGFKGVYYRFMARLTGKKMLSEKAEK